MKMSRIFSIKRINYGWCLLKKEEEENKTATIIIKESKQNNEKSINKFNQGIYSYD